jgi:hypothetical protein
MATDGRDYPAELRDHISCWTKAEVTARRQQGRFLG